MNIAWVSSWNRVCGIADYSKTLVPALEQVTKNRIQVVPLEPPQVLERLVQASPDLIHFQHEYGLWGGKNPPFYRFPSVVKALRERLPKTKLVATAHTVLASDYHFPVRGSRPWQIPARALANAFLLPSLQRLWGPETWGGLDAVIVHSGLQHPEAPRVEVIPHFVPQTNPVFRARASASRRQLLVFGFFTPEKGQDVAIEALALLPKDYELVLAGGVRRQADQPYYDRCMTRIRELGLRNRVTITGFLDQDRIDGFYAGADLVLVPFRETSGSGSLVQALARGAAVLASDLPLNRELSDRVPGSLAFFRSEDARDCAARIEAIFSTPGQREALSAQALEYAQRFSVERIAELHVNFYRKCLV